MTLPSSVTSYFTARDVSILTYLVLDSRYNCSDILPSSAVIHASVSPTGM